MKKFLSNFLIIFLLVILIFVIYSRYIRKDKMIDFFGYKFLIVLTGSMEPEIQMGSFVIIRENENYNVRRYNNLQRKWLFCNS